MKRSFLLLAIFTGFFSSSFFVNHDNNKEEVSAMACTPGQYYDEKELGCKVIKSDMDSSKNYINESLKKMADGREIKSSWTHKFGRFMIILSVGVSYATQVFAALTIVYSAYLYATSEGDMRKVMQAKRLILLAFGGMFIATSALIIVKMIGGALG